MQYKYLSRQLTDRLMHALITTRLDYCNSLLYAITRTNNSIEKNRRLQNAATRVVHRAPKFCHITPTLFGLHCSPVRSRVIFHILTITFKAIHNMVPKHLSNLITFKKSSMSHLRSNKKILLSSPIVKTRLGDVAFEAAAPKLWNDLPHDITITGDFTSFKQKVIRGPFKRAYQSEVVIFIFYFIFY